MAKQASANRIPRTKRRCTRCTSRLPNSPKAWGLIWEDGSGFCKYCLIEIRLAVGFYPEGKAPKLPKRRAKT